MPLKALQSCAPLVSQTSCPPVVPLEPLDALLLLLEELPLLLPVPLPLLPVLAVALPDPELLDVAEPEPLPEDVDPDPLVLELALLVCRLDPGWARCGAHEASTTTSRTAPRRMRRA